HVINLDHDQDTGQEFYQDFKLLTDLVLLQYLFLSQRLSKKKKKFLSYHVMQSDSSCLCISDCDSSCVFLLFLNNKTSCALCCIFLLFSDNNTSCASCV